jgi:hypothetical protein
VIRRTAGTASGNSYIGFITYNPGTLKAAGSASALVGIQVRAIGEHLHLPGIGRYVVRNDVTARLAPCHPFLDPDQLARTCLHTTTNCRKSESSFCGNSTHAGKRTRKK